MATKKQSIEEQQEAIAQLMNEKGARIMKECEGLTVGEIEIVLQQVMENIKNNLLYPETTIDGDD